jgi:hypothetical protein
MLKDISVRKLLIILVFMVADQVNKPNFIRNYVNDYPIFKWLVFLLFILKRKFGLINLILIFTLYQIFNIIDSIYFK